LKQVIRRLYTKSVYQLLYKKSPALLSSYPGVGPRLKTKTGDASANGARPVRHDERDDEVVKEGLGGGDQPKRAEISDPPSPKL
jgi:hypothetical protein